MNGLSESMGDAVPSRKTPPSLIALVPDELPQPVTASAAAATAATTPDARRRKPFVLKLLPSLTLRHLYSLGATGQHRCASTSADYGLAHVRSGVRPIGVWRLVPGTCVAAMTLHLCVIEHESRSALIRLTRCLSCAMLTHKTSRAK